MMLNMKNITPKFGVEYQGKKQLLELSAIELKQLKKIAAERCIVVARDQEMTLQQQADFAHRLGEPYIRPNNPEGVPEELIRVQTDQNSKYAAGQLWHSDASSDMEPPGLSMLRMEVVPDSGGDTVFADMYQAFETLSGSMQRFLQSLRALHVPRAHYLYTSGLRKLEELESSLHPVVRLHPITNRRALYVNAAFVEKIEGLNGRESRSILAMLYDHIAYSVNIQCRVQWCPGTVVFWDNRCVQHYASFDYFPALRRGYRITIRGEKPLCTSNSSHELGCER